MSLPTNLGIYRQDAKFAKADLWTKIPNFIGALARGDGRVIQAERLPTGCCLAAK